MFSAEKQSAGANHRLSRLWSKIRSVLDTWLFPCPPLSTSASAGEHPARLFREVKLRLFRPYLVNV